MRRTSTKHDLRLWGHRGSPAELPENTLESFGRALERGANALELDVHLTRDGVPVVSHDPSGRRRARVPRAIRESTLAEVQRWDVGQGLHMPTLEQVLGELPSVPLSVDLKPRTVATIEPVLSVIRRHQAERRVTMASFHTPVIRAVRRAGYCGPTALARAEIARLVAVPGALGRLAAPAGTAVQVPMRQGPIVLGTRRFIAKCHALGLRVDFWTIDEPAEAARLLELGADGIMSNDPAALRPVLDAHRARRSSRPREPRRA
jgi:glycerophosphoryl diester phosphodiesterase